MLVEKYKRELRRITRRLRLVKKRDEYFNKKREKLAEAIVVNKKVCPFNKMIIEARRNENVRDMLLELKNMIEEWDWTDVRPVEEEETDELDDDFTSDIDDVDSDSDLEAGHTGKKNTYFAVKQQRLLLNWKLTM